MNSGAETLAKLVKLSDIRVHEDFESLFMINSSVLAQIVSRMKKYGYDKSQPILLWKEEKILIDGHTRRLAAIECGFFDIPVYEHSFESLEDAIEYALGLQTARRNLTDAEIVNAMGKLDKLKKTGRSDGEKGKSAEHLAETLGTSTTKIERARAIEKKASANIKEALASGEMSINQAYEIIRQPTEQNQDAISTKSAPQTVTIFQEKETPKYPCFSLSEVVDVLCRKKLYLAVVVLLTKLEVANDIKQIIAKKLPENIQKSLEVKIV